MRNFELNFPKKVRQTNKQKKKKEVISFFSPTVNYF